MGASALAACAAPGATPSGPQTAQTSQTSPAGQAVNPAAGQPARAQPTRAAGGASSNVRAPAAATPAPSLTGGTPVKVRRGTITESVKVLGRVASAQEADLYFKTTGRLRGLFTESGQVVHAGDVLAELETGDLATKVGKAQADVENARIKLEQARAKAVIPDTSSEEAAVAKAQIDLDQAKLQLEKLKSGALDSDLASAQAAVEAARTNLQKVRSDLAQKQSDLAAKQASLEQLLAGPSPADLAKAQADVEAARAKLQQASSGPRPEDVQAAQLRVEQARLKLQQLRDTPPASPEDIANAQLAVQQAQANLDKARADTSGSPAQREAAVRAAEIALETAKNNLDKLQHQQPSPWDIRQAEEAVASAENDLAKLQNAPAFDLQSAQIAYDQAVAKLAALQRPPSDDELASLRAQIDSLQHAVEGAQAAVPSAEAALAAAEAKLAALQNGPNGFDLSDAESKVQTAQAALDQARAKLEAKRSTIGVSQTTSSYDVQLLEKALQAAQITLQTVQQQYDDARIVAPFDGKITKVNGKPGDNINAFTPVISISSPSQLLVQAQVADADIPKLAVGQQALITLDVFPGQVLKGTVIVLPSSVVTQQGVVSDKTVKIAVDWTRPGAEVGMSARVQINVQQKDGVLIVPKSAVRTVGKRTFVEYLDGNVKRSRNVEVGIVSDQDAEIVSGLEEGMTVIAGA